MLRVGRVVGEALETKTSPEGVEPELRLIVSGTP